MKPILFNTEMVRAILKGKKTQTRRILKCNYTIPKDAQFGYDCFTRSRGKNEIACRGTYESEYGECFIKLPYSTGDILYVRETWKAATGDPAGGGYALFDTFVYKADGKAKDNYPVDELMVEDRWRPSTHMPKEAARIFLRVTSVRVERLQNIQSMDAIAEGAEAEWHRNDCGDAIYTKTPICTFAEIWDKTIKPGDLDKYGWYANPWVWVIDFERIEKEEKK